MTTTTTTTRETFMDQVLHLPGTKIETRWVLVTAAMAAEFLERNTRNRNLRPQHLNRIAADQASGRFVLTHQGIAFDLDGNLLDGQHRLQAIVMTGEPMMMMVTLGLDPEAQKAMDGGAKRQAQDFMQGPYTAARTGASRILIALDRLSGTVTASTLSRAMAQVTTAEILGLDDDRSDLLLALAKTASDAARIVPISGAGTLLAAASVYPDKGYEFLDGISRVAGLPDGDPRAALIRYRGRNGTNLNHPDVAFLCLKTAQLYVRGALARGLRLGPSETLKIDLAR